MLGPDERDPWDENALVRALGAPGTPEELEHEDEFLAMFRAQQQSRTARRFAGRFGVGATTAIASIALTAGVAAAYGRVLPDPVQNFAHGVLGTVGVPAPEQHRTAVSHHTPVRVIRPTPVATSSPGGGPSKLPLQPSPTLQVPTKVGTTGPTGAPIPIPTPTGGTTPTSGPATPVPRVPGSLSASTATKRVQVGSSVIVTGTLFATDGHPLRQRVVRLLVRSAGQPWALAAAARTDVNGNVTLSTAALTTNSVLRLTSAGVHSPTLGVVVVPVIEGSSVVASGLTTVTVTVRGCQAGDAVTAYRHNGTQLVQIGTAVLDATCTGQITVPTPKHVLRIVLRTAATKRHAKAQTTVTIGSVAS